MTKKIHGLTGKPRPPEVREKIAAAKRGVPRTYEAKAAISAGKRGKPRSDQARQAISDGLRRYHGNKSHKSDDGT